MEDRPPKQARKDRGSVNQQRIKERGSRPLSKEILAVVSGGGARYPKLTQSFPRLKGFVRTRTALDNVAKGCDSAVLVSRLNQGESLLEFGRSRLVAIRKTLQHLVVVLHGVRIFAGVEIHFREIEIGISGKVGVWVVLDVLVEL